MISLILFIPASVETPAASGDPPSQRFLGVSVRAHTQLLSHHVVNEAFSFLPTSLGMCRLPEMTLVAVCRKGAASVMLRPVQVPRALSGAGNLHSAGVLVTQAFPLHFDFSNLCWLHLQVGKIPSYPCFPVFQKLHSRADWIAQYFSDLEASGSPVFP